MSRKPLLLSMIVCALLTLAHSMMAQTTTATLSGEVTDESGAVLPGAQIAITNAGTGLRRSVTTDGSGRFRAPQLPPGEYEVSATMTGFDTLVRQGLTLAVGQEATLNLAMKVGAVSEQVTVTGDAPLLNTSSSAVAGLVEEKRIQELPLNGRDFSQLPLVQPGVYSVRNSDQTVSNKGYGTRVSMGGSRPDQTSWLLDGTNIKSMANFGTPGSAGGLMLGVDAVREFQVLTSNYSAEFGKSSGGVINMISKSGTNSFHGTLYEFLRNSALDARNFFEQDKASFKRNQFGGAFGGPIKKDKTFFFGNYEEMIQRLGLTQLDIVPDANMHKGLLPDGKGGLQPVAVAPEIRPYLDLYPSANGGNILDSKTGFTSGTANLYAPGNNSVDEYYFVTRVDHHLSDSQSLFARVNYDQGSLSTPDPIPISNSVVAAHTRYATVEYEKIVSPQLLATTRVAYNRTLLASNLKQNISWPESLNLLIPNVLPTISIPGATSLGQGTSSVFRSANNLYEFQEGLQYIRGGHSMKFGADIEKVGYNRFELPSGSNASFTWSTLTNFLTDARPQSFAASAPGGDSYRTWRQMVYGTYFQDDWKLNQKLTVNLGLRYEPYTVPDEKHGRVSNIKDWVHATAFDTNIPFFQNPSKKNFSPRIGFAWDPKGDGKTAIRGGFGMFFLYMHGAYIGTPGSKNPPYFASTASVLGNLATAVADVTKITSALLSAKMTTDTFMELVQWDLKPSYEMKANLTVVRQLPGNMSLSVGYLGDRGIHLWRNTDVNTAPFIILNGREFVPNGATRINPVTGVGTTRYSDAQSFYNAMQVEVKKNFSHGFQFQTSYTWSKNIDDATTGVANTDFNEGQSSQAYNSKVDRGLSALNQGQNLVFNAVYQIPSLVQSGLGSYFASGWQASTIFSASTGSPFSPRVSGRNAPDLSRSTGQQRPDLVAGRNTSNIVLGDPNQYFDTSAFYLPPAGYFGNAGRNIINAANFQNFDLSLTKNTPLGFREGARLEFKAEFFNLLNRANFASPSALQVLNPTNGQFIAGAGKITRTLNSSRQMQFGLKMYF